ASYASLLVDRCIDVQPGWQGLVRGTPAARPLAHEGATPTGPREAHAPPRLYFSRSSVWTAEGPEEQLGRVPEIDAHELDNANSFIVIDAPENTREGADISPE